MLIQDATGVKRPGQRHVHHRLHRVYITCQPGNIDRAKVIFTPEAHKQETTKIHFGFYEIDSPFFLLPFHDKQA